MAILLLPKSYFAIIISFLFRPTMELILTMAYKTASTKKTAKKNCLPKDNKSFVRL